MREVGSVDIVERDKRGGKKEEGGEMRLKGDKI